MYAYMLQTASLASLLRVAESDTGLRVARAVRERCARGRGALPPVYVVHGDADRFVGVEQADELVDAIREGGGTVVYERLAGVDHLFDKEDAVEMEGMYRFMMRYVGG